MKKMHLISVGMILAGMAFYFLNTIIDSFSIQVKFGFLGKVLFISGILSFWLFVILGKDTKENQVEKE